MPGAQDLNFRQIAPRLGGQHEAFEELCCQLARRYLREGASFTRLHGAGGDGGVECFADLPDGARVGWQAKFVFDVNSLIRQLDSSLDTALRIHPTLTRYIVCFPFDPTGPTGRQGRSGMEKLEEWRRKRKGEAAANGREIEIELWAASQLRSLLLDLDVSGGLRLYFFDKTVLGDDWFSRHLDQAIANAGPRYTPELNVETNLYQWFEAFGHTCAHTKNFQEYLQRCRKAHEKLKEAANRTKSDAMVPAWPGDLREKTRSLLVKIEGMLEACEDIIHNAGSPGLSSITPELEEILQTCAELEGKLLEDLRAKYPDWKGNVDSPGFRQFMAEYMVSFPAANLDDLREAAAPFRDFHDWLRSPEGFLAFEPVFLLTGDAGVGKTHGICDVARRRRQDGLPTCVVFGHRFGGEPDPWTRILEILGLPVTLGREGLLDALNAAGEATGQPLLLCIDAINETKPLRYLRDHLAEVVQAFHNRPYLKLCVSCRTPYVLYCVPEEIQIPKVEYKGFAGAEDYACRQFFEFYGLEPPVDPILQPELKNPLYLRLVCETLKSQGKRRLPSGWRGIAPVIRAFIAQKEKEFAIEFEISQGANIVGSALRSISQAVAQSANVAIPRSSAEYTVQRACPSVKNIPVVDWLIGNGLLIEEAPITEDPLGEECSVRPAFERLGDFIVADSLLSEISSPQTIRDAFLPGRRLHYLVQSEDGVAMHGGVLGALSILIPERHQGVELADLMEQEPVRRAVTKTVIDNLPWRSPNTFSASTENLLYEGLANADTSFEAMDSILSVAWQPSPIDSFWLDDLLRKKPMARRDAYWCAYLHDRYESSGVVRRLIDAAIELPLERMATDILERWSVLLLWFTAAADRRVKDRATRAVIRLFSHRPEIIPKVVERFTDCDDDAVRERVLLSAYGALILTRDVPATGRLAEILCRTTRDRTAQFGNALIRDHARCILELSEILGALPESCDPVSMVQSVSPDWPLVVPDDKQVEQWAKVVRFRPDEFFSDFFKYSMNCLRPWTHAMSKSDMGKWILQRVARDFGYVGSGCESYDAMMLQKYGPGRAKPTWAERIGKKYQWSAMYQLASRLHDHVERQRDSWEPNPLRTPLILLEERKLDPTLSPKLVESEDAEESWWVTAAPDVDTDRQLSDEEWVAREDDLPRLDDLLSTTEHQGQKWRLLVAYPSWGRRPENAEFNDPYRNVWIHLHSYLVQRDDFSNTRDCLLGRNFFGRWMPEGAEWLYGFAGEYPWGSAFNTTPEEWHSRGGFGQKFPVRVKPAWNTLVMEWEYDASVPRNFHMLVPAREFFSPNDLWWDGRDGYRLLSGRTVFRDPSITEGGPASLLADADDLPERLERLGLRLIWTLLGEKWILGGSHDRQTPRRTFSQIAYLAEDGSVHVGERVFFDDYDRDTGPNPIET